MPTPEERARINIDKHLSACGWIIQDMSGLNRYASLGVAVRELQSGNGEELSALMPSVLDKAFKGELRKDLTGFHGALVDSCLCLLMDYDWTRATMKPVRSDEKVNALPDLCSAGRLQSHTGMISASREELYVFSPVKQIYFDLYSINMM